MVEFKIKNKNGEICRRCIRTSEIREIMETPEGTAKLRIHEIVFDDEITLWWTKDEFCYADGYKLYLDGKLHGEKDKTHYTFSDLHSEQVYRVRIQALKNGQTVSERELTVITRPSKNKIDITNAKYGAVGDGKTMNTFSIHKALDDCTEKDVVIVPKGRYLTGALNIHSNTEVYLAEGATLMGSKDENDYLPKIKSRFEGIENMSYRSLLNMGELDRNGECNCQNVVLRGKGCICGGGINLHVSMIDAETERIQNTEEYKKSYVEHRYLIRDYSIAWRVRGRLINISNADTVILAGLRLEYGPAWTIHPIYSRNVITYGCTVTSIGINNGDGWDPDSSENCVIFDTVFDTGDDCIAIKSGKNPEGNVINKPSKDIYVFDCRTISGHSGVGVGSEMSGGVENVQVWDCDFAGAWYGVHIKATKERGGYVKNVDVRDCKLSSIVIGSVDYNTDGASANSMPVFADYHFENIEISGFHNYYVRVNGFDEEKYAVQNVTLKDIALINVAEKKALRLENCKNLRLENVTTKLKI